MRAMGRDFSDHYVVRCKVKLMGAWIKRRAIVNGARSIISKNLREHRHLEGYPSYLEIKRVEWNEESNVNQMWEHVGAGNA